MSMQFYGSNSEVLKSIVVDINISISECLQLLNTTGLKILLATDAGQFIGTITDGDLRRGLLNGAAVTSSVSTLVYRSPIVAPAGFDSSLAYSMMSVNSIDRLPVISDLGELTGIYIWDSFESSGCTDTTLMIVAGGLGKRLLPLTAQTPKPMLKVSGKPIIEHIILKARSQGICKFLISTGYLAESLVNYLGDGSQLDVEISYQHETKPLGTCGFLSLLKDKPTKSFIVSNSDVLSNINYRKLLQFHDSLGSIATIAAKIHSHSVPFGVIECDDSRIVQLQEKPTYQYLVNAGIYVLRPSCLSHLEYNAYCDMPSFLEALISKGHNVGAYPMSDEWLDVGRHDDFARAEGFV